MERHVLALDNILSATFFFVGKWTPALKRNQSRDLIRFLLCRLYDESRGNLLQARVSLAQGTLARKLGLSRQWIGILLARLQNAGWIEYAAPTLDNGMKGSTTFRVGRQLKRLLITLLKSRPAKKPMKSAAKSRWQFSPLRQEKEQKKILALEKLPPSPHILQRIPLLRTWLDRGEALST